MRAGGARSGRTPVATLVAVLIALSVACSGADGIDEVKPSFPMSAPVAAESASAVETDGSLAVASAVQTVAPGPTSHAGNATPRAVTATAPDLSTTGQPAGVRDDHGHGEAAATSGPESTVEELLAEGLHLAGASPVHLAMRGTAGADSVRCAWRGITRTAAQQEEAIRFWLRLDTTETIPDAGFVETLFVAVLDSLAPAYRETAKSNFRAIARGGLSEEYLFLTCFADYMVSSYLLGAGPTTVTVAYDNRGEAASYELYVREHEAGTYGTDALQARGDYEASLQAKVVVAEEALAAEVGGRERIVFLAPMGAHHAIAFEAWQAVAHWDVVTADDSTVNVVRVGAPEGDPEHTQTLANLASRITTAAASDAHATTRIANVTGLQQAYRDMGAYGDITPGDGETTTFTPAQPPPVSGCANGTAVATPSANRGLVRDCETLLAAQDTLRGTATLDWATSTAIGSWEGITTGGTPSRVTGLDLASESLTGTIPAGLGRLFALTTLDLSGNQLTGTIPPELGWLTNLTERPAPGA